MELYMNPSEVSEIIGVDEVINKTDFRTKTYRKLNPFCELLLHLQRMTVEKTEPILQLRVDGLAPLITQLSLQYPYKRYY